MKGSSSSTSSCSGSFVVVRPLRVGFRNIKEEARARARELRAAANEIAESKKSSRELPTNDQSQTVPNSNKEIAAMESNTEFSEKAAESEGEKVGTVESKRVVLVGGFEIDLNLPPPNENESEEMENKA
ncbi:uncharacterized protein A4U43_C05F31020 [Asparagus officinalis]|uniref:Uncharacterized protein n=1 Tax=Asparagus officinalis TaxID=4686 RepID=A0A5P1EXJ9_ASPOF|nr:uncharacterized protein A4U43_C05F31020 [Asparagus officinalis]